MKFLLRLFLGCIVLLYPFAAALAQASERRTYEITLESIKATSVSGGEPGSENEFYGNLIVFDASNNNGPFIETGLFS